MNWQQVKTNWKTVRDHVHANWAKLTDDDLDAIAGKRNELVSLIQKRYAMTKDRAEKEAERFIESLN